MKRRHLFAAALLSLAASPLSAMAQDGAPIRLIVPFAAGGSIDITARALAEAARPDLGTIIIENKPGAGGNIGMDQVAKAKPDGSVIGVATLASNAVNPWLYKTMPYDASKDFAPVTMMVKVPHVLVMNAEQAKARKIASVADLIAYAKAHPGTLNYGSGGNGSGGHLAGEMFKKQTGLDIVHVPYNGGAPAQLALLSGQIDFTFDNLASAAANIASGKLVALGVMTNERSAQLPDVPTLKEAGLGDFSVTTWWGLVAPAGTPADVVERLNKAFVKALNDPATKQRFSGLMVEPAPSSVADMDAFMKDQLSRYESVVHDTGVSVD